MHVQSVRKSTLAHVLLPNIYLKIPLHALRAILSDKNFQVACSVYQQEDELRYRNQKRTVCAQETIDSNWLDETLMLHLVTAKRLSNAFQSV